MSGIENTIIARLEKGGEKFELLVDPKLGYEYKTGAKKELANVLVAEEVFKDALKGERHTASALQKAFKTTDIGKIAEIIFREGELQLTTDQRKRLLEEKRVKLVALIARNVMDPRTKAPHPPQRIEAALEQAKFHVEAFKTVEEQMEKAVDAMREIIPISMEKVKIAVKIPAQFAPKAYGLLKEYGISKEEWGSDGSLMVVCQMAGGVQGEFYDRINRLTGGQAQTKLL